MAIKEPKKPVARREPEFEDKPSPFSIDGIRSGGVQSRLFKILVVASGLIMAGGFAMQSLEPGGIPRAGQRAQNAAETVASVGGQTISGGKLDYAFTKNQEAMTRFGMQAKVDTYMKAKQDALKQLTNQAALVEAAQKANIQVSDDEVDKEIDKELRDSPDFKPQPGQSQGAFLRAIQQQFKVNTLEEAIAAFKEKSVSPEGREQIRQKLMVDKLGDQTKNATATSEDDYKRSVTKLDLYQILVRPELPKGNSKNFKADSAKLAADAQGKATKLVAQLKANPTLANFKAVAQKESADFATKTKGGSLGFKLPSQLPDPALGEQLSKTPQNLVGPIEAKNDAPGTQAIYFINARKTELPKDYAKNKKKLLADFQKSQGEAAWSKKQDELQKAINPDVSDPALAAFQLQSDLYTKQGAEQQKARDEALARYDIALQNSGGTEAAAINFQKSVIFRDIGKVPEQLVALKAAAQNAKNDAGVQLAYAQALKDGGQPKAALDQFKVAAQTLDDNPTPPSMFGTPSPDGPMRQQLAQGFTVLKEPKLAAAQLAKIKPAAPNGVGGASPFQIQPMKR